MFCGDLTWASLPQETLALVREMGIAARFVRGNADRAVGSGIEGRGEWMAAAHPAEETAPHLDFEQTVVVDIDGLGATCFRAWLASVGRGVRHHACNTPQAEIIEDAERRVFAG